MNIYEKLQKIQLELEVPKNQFNAFGKYNYRSCEDILSAVKPVAAKYDCVVKVSDEMVEVGGRCYVKATARLIDCGEANTVDTVSVEATGYAREEETKKGMDAAQITGAASSYARKYALNGLFCLDDTKDADSTNNHNGNGKPATIDDAKQVFKKMISKDQTEDLKKLAEDLNLTATDMKDRIKADYKVNGSQSLTHEQAGDLIAALQSELIN